jgi:hypothetical protein
MRTLVSCLAAAGIAAAGCSDGGGARQLPPDTQIDDHPAAITNQGHARVTFHAAGRADGFTCQLDATPAAPCASPFEIDLGDGEHTLRVAAALDDAIDTTPATATWRIDTVPPETAIASGPPPLDNSQAPEFAFSGTDDQAGAVSFECSLDDAAFTACTTPATAAVTDGNHRYRVRAVDAAGNVDPTPAARDWVVDTTAPDTVFSAGPAAGGLTGAKVSFSFGSPDSPVTFECALDGAAFATCQSPVALTLADGSHTFAARAKDDHGLVDPSPATRTWTVDGTPPAVSVTAVGTPTKDSTPDVAFTVTGATVIECRVDGGSFAACTSPFTPAALTDGSHTVTVRGTDAALNAGSGSTTFMVDTAAPPVAFDDAPPAAWPVNYFDMKFHTTDATAKLACSLNGAAFAACTSPLAITTSYGAASTFAVQAADPAGNVTTISTSWTSSEGLVLHYPWEQGQTHNTSLLAQNAAYSPDGSAGVNPVGGWAGTAAAAPAKHSYPATIRALSSSATGGYTASIWVRIRADASGGTILSTLASDNGFALSFANRIATLTVNEGGKPFTASSALPMDQWVQLGVMTTGTGKGLQLLVNGVVVGTATPPKATGFGAGQDKDLIVGALGGMDIDDLRFYNRALASAEICSVLVRGQLDSKATCVPLIPGFELDFENGQVRDTGNWNLAFVAPKQSSFVNTKFGMGLTLGSDETWGYSQGFAGRVSAAPGHSFSLWFVAGNTADMLIDFLHVCGAASAVTCGIRVTYSPGSITVIANGGAANPFTKTIEVGQGPHSVVVTEQKQGDNPATVSLTTYLDGVATVMAIGGVNVFVAPSDTVIMPHVPGTSVDEYEFWPRDLSLSPDMLCENGWDGEWNPATGTCLLLAN